MPSIEVSRNEIFFSMIKTAKHSSAFSDKLFLRCIYGYSFTASCEIISISSFRLPKEISMKPCGACKGLTLSILTTAMIVSARFFRTDIKADS